MVNDTDRQIAVRFHKWRSVPKVVRGADRVAIGLFLGGVVLGTAGCILGACMPYRHPVGVTISILWWGIYLGCLGASIGAGIGGLSGLRRNDTQAPSPGGDASGHRHKVQTAAAAAETWVDLKLTDADGLHKAVGMPADPTTTLHAAKRSAASGNVLLATHERSGESGRTETPA
jgi:hypothetical protein